MKVIALKGNSNVGKSETLNIVYQLMLASGYTQAPSGTRHFQVLGDPKNRDFSDILLIESRRVGFATMGDYATKKDASVRDLLAYLDSQGCDTAICACNLGLSGTINAVSAYSNHHFIDKQAAKKKADERIENGHYARQIAALI